ncbi:nitroreductase [Streptomyces sp. 5K101]|uniref:nitroreductase n=1 Tax=Streptomyces sp. 5K101 TaxID=3390037 RepID=UPI0039749746
MTDPVRPALARARSAEEPGPDTPAGPARPALPGEPLPVPPELDRLLRPALAGDRLRPTPSAGALHPVDTYLVIGSGCSVRPGRYVYDPAGHRIRRRSPLGRGRVPAGAVAVLAVAARRTVSHYGHRAWPLVVLDTGHAAAALALAGAPAVCLDADGALLSAALGRPLEPALAAVQLLPGDPDALLVRSAAAGTVTLPYDAVPVHGDLAEARRVLAALAAAGAVRGTWRPAPDPVPSEVLLARRSAAPGFGGVPGRADLARVLAAARAAAPDGPAWSLALAGPRPGILAAPADGRGGRDTGDALPRVASGDVLPTLAHWGARQPWIALAGAVLLAHGCPSDAPVCQVRRDHLLAGYGMGHAQAAATALGLASRPVGSWQGADLGAALGEPPGRDWVLHGLALGRDAAAAEPDPMTVTGLARGRDAAVPEPDPTTATTQGDDSS